MDSLLDTPSEIAKLDSFDALGLALNTPEQLVHSFGFQAPDHSPVRTIVFAGMGGSSLQAEFAGTWPELHVPYVLCKDYTLPAFVDSSTLVIAASYSGNTEETISVCEQALEKDAMLVVCAGGGKLEALAREHTLPFIQIPKAVQPRMAVFYSFRILVEIFVEYGVVPRESYQILERTTDHLQTVVTAWSKDIPTDQNPAKQLALQCVNTTPIIYSGPRMAAAAYKWKIGFNENAKNTSWMGSYPEFNHNEFMGWTSHPVDKPFTVIDLISSFEHPRTQLRFQVSDRLLEGMRPDAITVEAKGETVIEQLLYLVLFGDFVTIYTGLLNGVDPSPVALVEQFKQELG